MRALAALLLVNLFFIAATLVAAGIVLALGTVAKESAPLAESWLTWAAISLLGTGAAVGFMAFVIRLIARPRGRAPARGPA